ncbi:MAG: hypothetical protein ACOY5B_17540 [Spirochaetota bacterium]
MAKESADAENFSRLLRAILPGELDALLAMDWQPTPLAGESVYARSEKPAGITGLGGALPFLEMRKSESPDGFLWTRSDNLARFLAENRALCRSYLTQARADRLALHGAPDQAQLIQVSAETAGAEAAAFAIFLATRAAAAGNKVLLADADDQNQFVFSLLGFADMPPVLTENLQKPSSFRTDLTRCISRAWQGVDYLNLQATSLRCFNDTELSRICGFLDADYDTIIIYSGRRSAPWLSLNAALTFSVCTPSLKGEMASLARHTGSPHLVLLRRGEDYYFPWLTPEFGRMVPEDRWQNLPANLNVLAGFVDRVLSARRLLIGNGDLGGALSVLNGAALYCRLSGTEAGETDKIVNGLQSRLRAYYPRETFFSARSAKRALARLQLLPVSVLIEVNGQPQLVTLPASPELLATAVFPQGVIPTLKGDNLRVSTAGPGSIDRFRILALRGQVTEIYSAERLRLQKPNALAALLEQLQV